MKISEYIAKLEAIKAEHGDLPVDTLGGDGRHEITYGPAVGFRKILKGRESRPGFWSDYMPIDQKGEKVVCI